jgi:hypothetical protein
VVHIHSGILFSHKQNEILSFAITTWMELKDATFSEINQAQKCKHHMASLTCGLKRADLIQEYNSVVLESGKNVAGEQDRGKLGDILLHVGYLQSSMHFKEN